MWQWLKKSNATGEERAVVLDDWPQPAVVSEPRMLVDDHLLSLLYRLPDDRFAVVRFKNCSYFVFGDPDDEALGGHPLAKQGLQFYSVHEVLGSSLIQELERRNSVHPRHNAKLYFNKKHYIFTFQDSTLECVVSADPSRESCATVFEREEKAVESWRVGFVGLAGRYG
jgi:hypothetical protein